MCAKFRLPADILQSPCFVIDCLLCLGDIVYNAEFPLCAPDVIFGPEDEHFHPFQLTCGQGGEEAKPLKSILSDWSYKDPTRLFALIQELRWGFSKHTQLLDMYIYVDSEFAWLIRHMIGRNEYSLYQQKRAEAVDDDRLKFEISTMLSREVIS